MTEESEDERDSRGTEAKRPTQREALRPAWQEGIDSGDAGVLDFAKLRDKVNLAEAIRRRFEPFGGVDDLVVPPREPVPEPPQFDFDETLAEARSKFADMLPEDLEAVIEEAVAAARTISAVPKADIDAEIGTKKHGGGKEE